MKRSQWLEEAGQGEVGQVWVESRGASPAGRGWRSGKAPAGAEETNPDV